MAIDLQDLARRLFAAANQLWTNTALRPDQYAQPVLALIALRQMEAKFLQVDEDLRPTFKGRLKPTPADYQARGAMFLPENARFSRLQALPEQADLGADLSAAMEAIAEANPDLRGVLPTGYRGLPTKVLSELLRLLAPMLSVFLIVLPISSSWIRSVGTPSMTRTSARLDWHSSLSRKPVRHNTHGNHRMKPFSLRAASKMRAASASVNSRTTFFRFCFGGRMPTNGLMPVFNFPFAMPQRHTALISEMSLRIVAACRLRRCMSSFHLTASSLVIASATRCPRNAARRSAVRRRS